MKHGHFASTFLTVTGCCIIAVSLLTGCSWNVKGDGVRVNAPAQEDERGEFTRH